MIGREIYQNPYMLVEADNAIYQTNTDILSREQIVAEMARYIDIHIANGGRAWHVVRHMLGLCNGLAGARQFRRYLSEQCSGNEVTSQVLFDAFAQVTLPADE